MFGLYCHKRGPRKVNEDFLEVNRKLAIPFVPNTTSLLTRLIGQADPESLV